MTDHLPDPGNMVKTDAETADLREGYNDLWDWFSLSRASWLTMPRVLMHEMPDEWQAKMAALCKEWDDAWDTSDCPSPVVSAKKGNKFTKWPSWVLNYRRPDRDEVERHRNPLRQARGK